MVQALEKTSDGMLRRKALICLFVNRLRTCCDKTKNVLVLIPPPVDPGEAPINIKIMRVNRPAFVNSPMG